MGQVLYPWSGGLDVILDNAALASQPRLEIPWPKAIRCDWCFTEPMPLQKHRAVLRVQVADDQWIKLCLGCWVKLALR
jgi:hypothetical protein